MQKEPYQLNDFMMAISHNLNEIMGQLKTYKFDGINIELFPNSYSTIGTVNLWEAGINYNIYITKDGQCVYGREY